MHVAHVSPHTRAPVGSAAAAARTAPASTLLRVRCGCRMSRRPPGAGQPARRDFVEPMLQVTLFAPGARLSAAAALAALYFFVLARQVRPGPGRADQPVECGRAAGSSQVMAC